MEENGRRIDTFTPPVFIHYQNAVDNELGLRLAAGFLVLSYVAKALHYWLKP